MSPRLALALLAVGVVLTLAAWARVRLTAPIRSPIAATARRPLSGLGGGLRRRPRPPGDAELAAWCRRVANGVRAGGSLTSAVVDADAASDPVRRPFPDVVHAVRRGQPLASAFRAIDADPAAAAGLAAPVLATCAELGGSTVDAIERVADVLVARAAERDERRTASAQATLSARVLTLLPLGVAGLLALTEPSIRQVLGGPTGLACVGVGATLDLAGWWWMRTLIGGEP
jgi:tight adherence protein B